MNTILEIRTLHSSKDMKLVQKLEEDVWNMSPIPTHQTVTTVKNGGIMLGAFHEEKLVGFSYGFPGFDQKQVYLCSHMLGIHPEYQDKGIGARLKDEQKKVAANMGYELITWTFDPLESRNAYLNLNKLNGICSTYYEDCYGEMEDGLNSGLPSDRFKIEWWIKSEHVSNEHILKNIPENEAVSLYEWIISEDGLPKLEDMNKDISEKLKSCQPVRVPVPANIQDIKRKDQDLAIDWRFKTREIFQKLFKEGYAVVSLGKNNHEPVHYYVLMKRDTLIIPKSSNQ